MPDSRPPIPDPMQRAIRQRCAFGCVYCGLPLYEYHHINGYKKEEGHITAEITLLCDKHHREEQAGLLPRADVIAADQDPFNKRVGVCKPYDLHYAGNSCGVAIGSNQFWGSLHENGIEFVAIRICEQPIISFAREDDHLLLNVTMFDRSNSPILRIVNNALEYSVSPWDIEFIGTNLIIRDASRVFFVDMTFDPPFGLVIDRGYLFFDGYELMIEPDFIAQAYNGKQVGQRIRGLNIFACAAGFWFGRPPGG
jgi:hypothetical protein